MVCLSSLVARAGRWLIGRLFSSGQQADSGRELCLLISIAAWPRLFRRRPHRSPRIFRARSREGESDKKGGRSGGATTWCRELSCKIDLSASTTGSSSQAPHQILASARKKISAYGLDGRVRGRGTGLGKWSERKRANSRRTDRQKSWPRADARADALADALAHSPTRRVPRNPAFLQQSQPPFALPPTARQQRPERGELHA